MMSKIQQMLGNQRKSSGNYDQLESSDEDSFVVPPPKEPSQIPTDPCIDQLIENLGSDLGCHLQLDLQQSDQSPEGATFFVTATDETIVQQCNFKQNKLEFESNNETLFQTVYAPDTTITAVKDDCRKENITATFEDTVTPTNTPLIKRTKKMDSEEEIPIAKGSYNIDFDNMDLESMNPFGTTKALANSPIKKSGFPAFSDTTKFDNKISENSSEQNQQASIGNHNIEQSSFSENDIVAAAGDNNNHKILPDASTNASSHNNHQISAVKEPAIPNGDLGDNLDLKDPFKSKSQIQNSPDIDKQNVNPFQSKSMVKNSPPPTRRTPDDAKEEAQMNGTDQSNSESTTETQKPKKAPPKKTVNSKLKKKRPGLAKRRIQKPTPLTQHNDDDADEIKVPSKGYSINFDDLENIDPFKTKSSVMMNSPTKSVPNETLPARESVSQKDSTANDIDYDNIDPFKSTKILSNSPVKKQSFDLISDSAAASSNNDSESTSLSTSTEPKEPVIDYDSIDPFKSKKTLANSPVKNQTFDLNTLSNNAEPMDPVSDYDNIDPFKSKKTLANSPVKNQTFELSLDSNTAISNNAEPLEPVVDYDNINPFESKKTLADSPVKKQTFDLNVDSETTASSNDDATVSLSKSTENHKKSDQPREAKSTDSNSMEDFIAGETFYPARDVFENQEAVNFQENEGSSKQPVKNSRISLYRDFDPLYSSPARNDEPVASDNESMNTFSTKYPTVNHKTGSSVDPENLVSTLMTNPGSALDAFLAPHAGESAHELKFTESDLQRLIAEENRQHEDRMKKIAQENKEIKKDTETFKMINKGYEELIESISKDKHWDLTEEVKSTKAELEAALDDLKSAANTHADLARRYEKLKVIVKNHKENEEKLKVAATNALQEAKKAHDSRMQMKKLMEEKVSEAERELKEMEEKSAKEIKVLQAQLKIKELKCSSLEKDLQQQEHQCKELGKLCDELIERAQNGRPDE